MSSKSDENPVVNEQEKFKEEMDMCTESSEKNCRMSLGLKGVVPIRLPASAESIIYDFEEPRVVADSDKARKRRMLVSKSESFIVCPNIHMKGRVKATVFLLFSRIMDMVLDSNGRLHLVSSSSTVTHFCFLLMIFCGKSRKSLKSMQAP